MDGAPSRAAGLPRVALVVAAAVLVGAALALDRAAPLPRPERVTRVSDEDRGQAPSLGLAVTEAAARLSVAEVVPGGPAARAGLRAGDVVVSLDGQGVATVGDWLRALREKQAGQRGVLVIERAGERRPVEVELAP